MKVVGISMKKLFLLVTVVLVTSFCGAGVCVAYTPCADSSTIEERQRCEKNNAELDYLEAKRRALEKCAETGNCVIAD